MDLTRIVFGPDAVDISAINGANATGKHAALGGAKHSRKHSKSPITPSNEGVKDLGVGPAGQNDESYFNCEV